MMDTGATTTIVASDVAELCEIKPVTDKLVKTHTATSKQIFTQLASIKDMSIGGLRIKNHPARITDEKNLQQYYDYKINGILGWNALKHLHLSINTKQKEMVIKKPQSVEHKDRNLFWLGFPIVKLMSKDGVTLHFGLDTGAFETTITDNIFKKIRFKKIYKKTRTIWGAGGEENIKSRVVPILELVLDGHLLTFKNVHTFPKHHAEFIELDGVLGNDLLQSAQVSIDYTNGLLTIQEF
jgi:predicted aspartyl protease